MALSDNERYIGIYCVQCVVLNQGKMCKCCLWSVLTRCTSKVSSEGDVWSERISVELDEGGSRSVELDAIGSGSIPLDKNIIEY